MCRHRLLLCANGKRWSPPPSRRRRPLSLRYGAPSRKLAGRPFKLEYGCLMHGKGPLDRVGAHYNERAAPAPRNRRQAARRVHTFPKTKPYTFRSNHVLLLISGRKSRIELLRAFCPAGAGVAHEQTSYSGTKCHSRDRSPYQYFSARRFYRHG
jgi:hypothetical protein